MLATVRRKCALRGRPDSLFAPHARLMGARFPLPTAQAQDPQYKRKLTNMLPKLKQLDSNFL